jgi:hypothetical protein
VAWLRHFDVDYVILHRHTMEWQDAQLRGFVETMLGIPRYMDRSVVAFPIPDGVPSPGETRLYALSQEGFHPPEQDGTIWRRWMSDQGHIYLYSAREEQGALRFTVDSHLELPKLEFYVEDQLLDSFVVGDRATYTTRPFTLSQGMNVLRFSAPDRCTPVLDNAVCWNEALLVPPVDLFPTPCEPETVRMTCRTFVFDNVSFVPQEELLPGEGLDINFGDQIRLRGWELEETDLRAGAPLTLSLTWEASVALNDQYVVFVHLLSADRKLVAQHDGPPVGQMLQSPEWPPGATFGYSVTIPLPKDLPAGDYGLVTGVYLWPSLERLPVPQGVSGAAERVVELGDVRIVP